MLIPGTNGLQGLTISELRRVADPEAELVGALHEVETPTGPNGSYENSGMTTEQWVDFLATRVGGAGSPGSGSTALYDDFIFTATKDGAQSFPMPAGTLGIDGQPAWYQADTKLVDTLANWDFTGGNLVTYAATDIKAGDKVFGRRYYGGTGSVGGAGGTVDASQITGVLSAAQLPALEDADIQKLAQLLQPIFDQRYVQQ